jgi:hypothetical protein
MALRTTCRSAETEAAVCSLFLRNKMEDAMDDGPVTPGKMLVGSKIALCLMLGLMLIRGGYVWMHDNDGGHHQSAASHHATGSAGSGG